MGFIPAKDKMDTDKLKVKVSFNGESKELEIAKGMDQIMPFVLGGKRFALDWESLCCFALCNCFKGF